MEANYALRSLVGAENYYLGVADNEARAARPVLYHPADGPAATPALPELEEADACVLLGEDLTNHCAHARICLAPLGAPGTHR